MRSTKPADPGRIRIIGGRLRGSRLDVPASPGLRPTPDRLRETLFNWLMPWSEGAHCLDLFAGTGALGIEAWSRLAASVVLVERDPALVQSLRANVQRLKIDAEVVQGDALAWLGAPSRRFDIVFIDPPFADNQWRDCVEALEKDGWLASNALIYVESPAGMVPPTPPHWQLWREARVGAVRGALYRRQP